MTGIPCRHALRVIMHMKWKSDDYVSDWYLTSKWRATYENSISPVTGMRFWRKTDETRIQPPTRPESKGRKKRQKRIKGKNESPKKKRKVQCGEESPKKVKASREERTMTCGHCGITGHYAFKCSNSGASVYRKTKKTTLSQGEGPNQESQVPPLTRFVIYHCIVIVVYSFLYCQV